MIRLLAMALLALALVVLLLLALPFTTTGTRLLLRLAEEWTPLQAGYSDGRLAGTLRLDSLALPRDGLDIRLSDVELTLDPRCLWRSALCGERLRTAAITVRFPGGEWHSDSLVASLELAAGRLLIHRLETGASRLTLESGDEEASTEPTVLPEIALPFALQVEELSMGSLLLDLAGQQRQLQAPRLQGRWEGTALSVAALTARPDGLGEIALNGDLTLAGDWPVNLSLAWTPGAFPDLGALAPTAGRLTAGGSLAALQLDLALEGQVTLTGRGEFRLLQPAMPFDVNLTGRWPGELPLAALPGATEDLPDLLLHAPLELSAGGDLDHQQVRLVLAASGLGYRNARLEAEARWDGATLRLDRALLQHGEDRLQASGTLVTADTATLTLSLDTAGFDLPAMPQVPAGRLAGGLRGEARFGEYWSVDLEDVNLVGEAGGLPARVKGSLSLRHDDLLGGSDLAGEVNGASLILRDGRLDAAVPDLGRWIAAAGGRLKVTAQLLRGGERLELEASANDLTWDGVSIAEAQASAMLDPRSELLEQLELQASGLRFQDLQLAALRVEGRGDQLRQRLKLESSGDLAGTLALSGERLQDGNWLGRLDPTELNTPVGYWRSPQAVELEWRAQPGVLRIAKHCWHAGATRLCLDSATLGESGDAALRLEGPLDFAAGLLPGGVGLEASVRGSLQANWTPDAPLTADARFDLPAGELVRVLPRGERLDVGWDRIVGRATFGEGGFGGSAEIDTLGGRAVAEWQLPAEPEAQASGQLAFDRVQLDALAALAPELDELAGRVDGRLTLTGSVRQPRLDGSITLSEGRLRVAGNPTGLEQLRLQLTLSGDGVSISGDGLLGDGPVQLEGELTGAELLGGDAAAGAPELRLSVTGSRHRLLVPPSAELRLTPDLELTATPGLVTVTGQVLVLDGALKLEQLPEGSVALSNDVVVVDVRGVETGRPPPFETGLDIALRIEDRFQVEGSFLSATLGGDLQLQKVPGQPLQLFGNLRTIAGEVRALGQVLRLERGTIAFSGPPERPDLNLRAGREIRGDDVRVGVTVLGSLQEPELEIYSSPAMSQTEAMSYLTRGRGLDSGASADSSALALSMGMSAINRSGLLSGLNRLPGVNNIELGTDTTSEGTTATVSGYLGRRLYLSYGTGVYEPITILTGRLYLQSRLWLEMVSGLENSLDIYYSFDID